MQVQEFERRSLKDYTHLINPYIHGDAARAMRDMKKHFGNRYKQYQLVTLSLLFLKNFVDEMQLSSGADLEFIVETALADRRAVNGKRGRVNK